MASEVSGHCGEIPDGWDVKKEPTFQGGFNFSVYHNGDHIATAFTTEMGYLIACAVDAYAGTHPAPEQQAPDALTELKKFIMETQWEEEYPRYTGDCHPVVKSVVDADDVVEKIEQFQKEQR